MTLSNPGLDLAILGNPGGRRRSKRQGARMASRRRSPRRRTNRGRLHYFRRNRTEMKRISQLARRWASRKSSGRFSRYAIGIRRSLRKPPVHASRWPWSGRRGSVDLLKKGHLVASNPRRRSRRRRSRGYALRINPSVGALARDYTAGLRAFPSNLKRVFRGKGMLMNAAVATGGAVVALAGGSLLLRHTLPWLTKSQMLANFIAKPVGQAVVGATHAWTAVFLVAKFSPIGADKKIALLTGGAAAVLTELVFPGKASELLSRIPGIGPFLAPVQGPVKGLQGLAGYVNAPAYQGIGTYVEAPGYQAVGANDDAIAGYVSAPSYQGVGGLGMAIGSAMPSFLDDGV